MICCTIDDESSNDSPQKPETFIHCPQGQRVVGRGGGSRSAPSSQGGWKPIDLDFWIHLDSGFGLWTEVQIAGEELRPRLIFWTWGLDLAPSPIWTFGLLGIWTWFGLDLDAGWDFRALELDLRFGLRLDLDFGFGLLDFQFGLWSKLESPIWT